MPILVILKSVFLFQNGMIMSFDQHGRQVPLLQGTDSPELRIRIMAHTDANTAFHGFEDWPCASTAWTGMSTTSGEAGNEEFQIGAIHPTTE